MDTLQKNKAVLRRYVEELWNECKYEVLDQIIHPNVRKRGGGLDPKGPAGYKQMIETNHQGGSDLRRTIVDMVAEGDKVVLYSTFTGTHTEEGADGFAPTGEKLEVTGVATWLIEDGKIIEEPWACWKIPALYQQIARAAMRQFIDKVWNGGDLDAAEQYIAPDYVRHDPAAPEDIQGLDGFREVAAMYRAAFPDLQLDIEEIIAAGDKGETVAIRWSGSGTHQGELMGVAPTGKQVRTTGQTFLRLEKGKIAEEWVHWDSAGMLQQLGAVLAEA
ncbi:MAG: hypothetical protein GKR89_25855 [Candidatus Latescibacteria bacterium]|nr:hypothetical protein [Candidatus Latescibacterota bacterium]